MYSICFFEHNTYHYICINAIVYDTIAVNVCHFIFYARLGENHKRDAFEWPALSFAAHPPCAVNHPQIHTQTHHTQCRAHKRDGEWWVSEPSVHWHSTPKRIRRQQIIKYLVCYKAAATATAATTAVSSKSSCAPDAIRTLGKLSDRMWYVCIRGMCNIYGNIYRIQHMHSLFEYATWFVCVLDEPWKQERLYTCSHNYVII